MANISNEQKERVALLMRELEAKQPLKTAVLRCMAAALLSSGDWLHETQSTREMWFVDELSATLDAVDYIIRRLWPAT